MNNQFDSGDSGILVQSSSTSSSPQHMREHHNQTSSIFKSALVLLSVVVISLPTSTNAVAFHRNDFSSTSPVSSSAASSASSPTSSNALALLNKARILREQKLSTLSTSTNGKGQAQAQLQEQYPSLPLPELLRRTSQNATAKKRSTTSSSSSSTSSPSSAWTQALFDDDDLLSRLLKKKEEEEEDFISNRVKKQLPSVKTLLQTSLGSDVPDMGLHLQMEAARARGKECGSVAALAFMEFHHDGMEGFEFEFDDQVKKVQSVASSSSSSSSLGSTGTVSSIEKVAMSSLPSQLPGLAATVLSGSNGRSTKTKRATTVSASARVTPTKTRKRTTRTRTTESSAASTTTTTTKPVSKVKSSRASSSSTTTTKKRKSPKSKKANANTTIKRRTNEQMIKKVLMKKKKSDKRISSTTVKKIQTKQVSNIMTARKALSETSSSPSSSSTSSTSKSDLSYSTTRVSHDEEIQLARIIQRGAELHSIKTVFEEENSRDITRQEWTELAKLDSPKELRRLVSGYRKAKSKLVMANMGLVHAVVRSRMRESGRGLYSYDGVSYEEMVQEGSLGLLRAAELFDPSRGLRFSTYATIWIKGVLGNSDLSNTITLPLRERNKFKKIQTAKEEIIAMKAVDNEDGGKYKPTDEEIGSRCGLDASDVKSVMAKMKVAKNVLSLDYQYVSTSRSGVEASKYDALSNDKNLMDDVDLVERLQLRADIVAALTRNLDPREARLMRLRYGLNDGKTRSIRECGEAMGISKARAQQLAVGCLKKLREADDAESLQEYLLSVA
jgi:RNA polymerase primary sigma factor